MLRNELSKFQLQDRPRKQKMASNLVKAKEAFKDNTDRVQTLVNKNPKTHLWFFIDRKNNKEEHIKRFPHLAYMMESNAELEAFAGSLYQLIIGKRQPKIRAIDNGASISKRIDGFVALGACTPLSINDANEKGAAATIVASYFLEETDLHKNNVGLNKKGEMVRIDFDNSLCPSSRKRFSAEGTKSLPTFPRGTHDPVYVGWCPTGLGYDPRFVRDKFKYLLKIILLNRQIFENIALDHLSKGNEDIVEYIEQRRIEFQDFLIKDSDFQRHLADNRVSYWSEIELEFKEYNQEIQGDIEKTDRKLRLLSEHPHDFQALSEFSKPKYRDLSLALLQEKLTQEKQEHISRLIDIEATRHHYHATMVAAGIPPVTRVEAVPAVSDFSRALNVSAADSVAPPVVAAGIPPVTRAETVPAVPDLSRTLSVSAAAGSVASPMVAADILPMAYIEKFSKELEEIIQNVTYWSGKTNYQFFKGGVEHKSHRIPSHIAQMLELKNIGFNSITDIAAQAIKPGFFGRFFCQTERRSAGRDPATHAFYKMLTEIRRIADDKNETRIEEKTQAEIDKWKRDCNYRPVSSPASALRPA
jgi:hypothetical protein